jgi:DNA-binding NarL/FixJ family response regulator
MHSSAKFIAEMFEAGASGYVVKECAFEELTSAIRTVAEGKTYISPEVAGTAMADYVLRIGNGPEAGAQGAVLSPREREILQLIAEGKAIKEIAAALSLSRKTVENHRSHIMDKLDIHTTAGITKYAIREGLTSVN